MRGLSLAATASLHAHLQARNTDTVHTTPTNALPWPSHHKKSRMSAPREPAMTLKSFSLDVFLMSWIALSCCTLALRAYTSTIVTLPTAIARVTLHTNCTNVSPADNCCKLLLAALADCSCTAHCTWQNDGCEHDGHAHTHHILPCDPAQNAKCTPYDTHKPMQHDTIAHLHDNDALLCEGRSGVYLTQSNSQQPTATSRTQCLHGMLNRVECALCCYSYTHGV